MCPHAHHASVNPVISFRYSWGTCTDTRLIHLISTTCLKLCCNSRTSCHATESTYGSVRALAPYQLPTDYFALACAQDCATCLGLSGKCMTLTRA